MLRFDAESEWLREKARALIKVGRLPSRRPRGTWGGPGAGETCALCALPVGERQMGYEAEFALGGETEVETLYFHARCFSGWELLVLEFGQSTVAPHADAAAPAGVVPSSGGATDTP